MVDIPPFIKPVPLTGWRDYRRGAGIPCNWAGCHFVETSGDPNVMDAHVRSIHMRDSRGNYRDARRAIRDLNGTNYFDVVNGRKVAPNEDIKFKYGRRVA